MIYVLYIAVLLIIWVFITVMFFKIMSAKRSFGEENSNRKFDDSIDDSIKEETPSEYKVGDIIKLRPSTDKMYPLKLLLFADRSPYGNEISAVREVLQKDNIDIVIMLGDHHDHDIEIIREYNSNIKIIGVLGNHDGFDFLERNGVEDINGRVYEANGVRIAGMQGSFKYKDVDYPSFTQEQSRTFAGNIGPANIFITHDSPRGYHEHKDDAHVGLEGISEYILKNDPIINIHGHQHDDLISIMENGTIIIGIYGAAILDMNNFTLKKVF